MSRAYEACLFDFDGTIAQSEDLHRRNFERTLNLDISAELWDRECVGKTERENLERMKNKDDLRSVDDLIAARRKLLEAMIDNGELMLTEGIMELLAKLSHDEVRCAVVSSNGRAFIENALHKADLFKYFDLLVCGDDPQVQGHAKPDPFPYLHAAELLHADSSRCIVVEDSMTGIRSGLNAGMPVVVIANNMNAGLEQSPMPGIVGRIADFTAFPSYLFAS